MSRGALGGLTAVDGANPGRPVESGIGPGPRRRGRRLPPATTGTALLQAMVVTDTPGRGQAPGGGLKGRCLLLTPCSAPSPAARPARGRRAGCSPSRPARGRHDDGRLAQLDLMPG